MAAIIASDSASYPSARDHADGSVYARNIVDIAEDKPHAVFFQQADLLLRLSHVAVGIGARLHRRPFQQGLWIVAVQIAAPSAAAKPKVISAAKSKKPMLLDIRIFF